jgi:hypothetical protein
MWGETGDSGQATKGMLFCSVAGIPRMRMVGAGRGGSMKGTCEAGVACQRMHLFHAPSMQLHAARNNVLGAHALKQSLTHPPPPPHLGSTTPLVTGAGTKSTSNTSSSISWAWGAIAGDSVSSHLFMEALVLRLLQRGGWSHHVDLCARGVWKSPKAPSSLLQKLDT